MDFGIAPPIEGALVAAVRQGLTGYLPTPLRDETAAATAQRLAAAHGWHVAPERVRLVADVMAAFEATVRHFSTPGSPIIVPTPAYMPFLTVPQTLGRDVVQVPMVRDGDGGRWVYDLDALAAAFAAGANLLVLCTPHNPTGGVLTRDEMREITEVVDHYGGRVFADEIHAPLVFEPAVHVPYASTSEAAAAHTVTATSASKAWNLPGVKCAQVILSNDADAAVWARTSGGFEHGASTLGAVADVAAYRDGGPWLGDVLTYLDGNRRMLVDLLAEHLPDVRYRAPDGTYLAWLDCHDLALAPTPGEFFADRVGVVLVDGIRCGEAGRGFVRLNVATPRPILEQAVRAMGDAVTRSRRG
ncbi:aminotransferase class I/II-fold pyridoxal phosphate-dependent enzyme [Rhodococcus rhodnii]|nr:aminotransferase class I/II-fold pyridoxal phosphate-dependent enzyme [Rhodococcus rhodnii]